jgi:hypothetical protein
MTLAAPQTRLWELSYCEGGVYAQLVALVSRIEKQAPTQRAPVDANVRDSSVRDATPIPPTAIVPRSREWPPIATAATGMLLCSLPPGAVKMQIGQVAASSSPACSGAFAAPTLSSRSVAAASAVALRTIGKHDGRLDLHFCVAHPLPSGSGRLRVLIEADILDLARFGVADRAAVPWAFTLEARQDAMAIIVLTMTEGGGPRPLQFLAGLIRQVVER